MEYSAWSSGQPDNLNGFNLTEDCLHLQDSKRDVNRRWNDMTCRSDETAEYWNIKPLCQLF